jgi:hypothetical protein
VGAIFRGCAISDQIFSQSIVSFGSCIFSANPIFVNSSVTLGACAVITQGLMATGSTFIIGDNTGAQGVGVFSTAFFGVLPTMIGNSILVISGAAGGLYAFDSGAAGCIVDAGTTLRLTGLMWGNNNTTYGLETDSRVVYSIIPTITGLVDDTRIGATDTAYAAIPFFDGGAAASGAGLVILDVL